MKRWAWRNIYQKTTIYMFLGINYSFFFESFLIGFSFFFLLDDTGD